MGSSPDSTPPKYGLGLIEWSDVSLLVGRGARDSFPHLVLGLTISPNWPSCISPSPLLSLSSLSLSFFSFHSAHSQLKDDIAKYVENFCFLCNKKLHMWFPNQIFFPSDDIIKSKYWFEIYWQIFFGPVKQGFVFCHLSLHWKGFCFLPSFPFMISQSRVLFLCRLSLI